MKYRLMGERAMQNKKVYILLTDTGTVFTRLIRLYTRKPYNHASISFDPSLERVYSFGRKTAKNPFIGGFVQEDVKNGLFKQATGVVLSFTITEQQWQQMRAYIQQLEEEKDKYRYNFLGLIAIIFNMPFNRKNAFFCSQFVASVLKESDIVDFDKPISLVTPHDLQQVNHFQAIYQGKLKDYKLQTVQNL